MAEDTQTPTEEELTPDETAAEDVDDGLPKNEVTIEDAGTLRKKVTIAVARERIDAKFNEMFGELGESAQVPGFRIGHAPRRLIEKRFGKEVGEDVRNALVGEAMGSAMEDEGLKVLGEPDIDLETIELPDSGAMTFSLEVEIEPEFDLPEYKGVTIERIAIEVTDEHVDQAVQRMLAPMAKLVPVDAKASLGDFMEVAAKIKDGDQELASTNVELRAAPGQVLGVPVEDLGDIAKGKQAGDKFSAKAKVPAGHPNEEWREKDVEIEFVLKGVKRLELPELTDEFAATVGFGSVDELRQAARASLEGQLEGEKQQNMRDQVYKHLLDNTELDLPEAAAARHTQRAVQRRCVELMMRGVPREQIEQNMQEIEKEVTEQAAIGLKLSFILGRIAEAEDLTVDEDEINSRVAQIARNQNRRPERLRSDFESDGRMSQLASNILDEKVADKILSEAKIVDAKPKEGEADEDEAKKKSAPKGAKKAAAKKTTKKKAAKPKADAGNKGAKTKKKAGAKKKTGGDSK